MAKTIVVALLVQVVAIGVLLVTALDIKAHTRVEHLGGVNVWGYRGPVMRQESANEIRIAMAGGDLAFGWGVAAGETMVGGVRQLVSIATDKPGHRSRPVTAVNIGAIGLRAEDYSGWIERFAYLHPDVLCLAVDPRSHVVADVSMLPDRTSPIFRAFGYAPILPLVVREKFGWRSVTTRSTRPVADSPEAYVAAVDRALYAAVAAAPGVVLVLPPFPDGDSAADHAALQAMVVSHFGRDARVRVVDLGDESDMYDEGLWLGNLVLSAAGHARAASHVAPAVLALVPPTR